MNNRRESRQQRIQTLVKWSGWGSSGLGLARTGQLLLQGQWQEASITAGITLGLTILAIGAKFVSGVINRFLDQLEEELEQQEEKLATWLFNQLKTFTVKFWWQLTSNFQGKYYQHLIYLCRDYLTQGLDKDRILKLEKVFVPLKVATEDIARVDPKIIQIVDENAKNLKEKQIWDFLVAMKGESAFRRIVILGAPGSGKTTLMRHITLTYAMNRQRRRVPKLIPVLLYLKDICHDICQNNPPLSELITQSLQKRRRRNLLKPPPNWFEDKLRQNQCLVLLDGLDEVADESQRQQVRNWVDEQMREYPDTLFILTSRPYGYKSTPLQESVTVLEVKPFNLKQIRQFLKSWYLQTEIMSRAGENDLGVQEEAENQSENLIERIRNNRALQEMATNPLLLTMIATVHRRGNVLPGKRVELYKEICQVLLEKRQRAKELNSELTATQKQAVLQVLALALMKEKTRDCKLSDKRDLIETQLATVGNSVITCENFIKDIRDICGLLVEKDIGVYEFAHLSFQEYLAALQVKESNQEHLLIKHLNHSWWHETIRLYAAQTNATNIIRVILENPTTEIMALAYDCLEEGFVDPEMRQRLEAKLEQDLESGRPKIEGSSQNPRNWFQRFIPRKNKEK